MSGTKPPPRITSALPLILNARTPSGACGEGPVRYEVTVRIPKVPLVVFATSPCCDTEVVRRYRGWAPSWYGHQICGWAIRSRGKLLGANDTVRVVRAGTMTVWLTVIGAARSQGGGTVAATVAVGAVPLL